VDWFQGAGHNQERQDALSGLPTEILTKRVLKKGSWARRPSLFLDREPFSKGGEGACGIERKVRNAKAFSQVPFVEMRG